jgi:thiol-disulfide isomerase/thioredoxin
MGVEMNLRLIFTLLLTVLSFTVLSAALPGEFESLLKAAPDDSTALAVVRQYIELTDDIEDLRSLQSYWQKLDPAGCEDYFSALLKKHPRSEQYIYLWARIQTDPKVQIEYGRKLVRKHPGFEYGYRLLLAVYQNELFITPAPDHPDALPWKADFKKDRRYFQQYLDKFPGNSTALYFSVNLLVWEKQVDAANKLVAAAVKNNAPWLTWQFYTDFYLRTGQLTLLQAYIRRMVDTSDLTRNLSDAEKESEFQHAYLTTLLLGEAYTELFAFVDANPNLLNDIDNQQLYLMACALRGESDRAFRLLDIVADTSGELYQWLQTDREMAAFRQDSRWEPMISRVRKDWEAGASARKADVLARKFSRPAPLWELKDAQGNLVRLADLKGQIVILDFWATWCEPCRDSMPLLDKWLKANQPRDVKVYSVNVWEREPDEVLAFMQEKGYAMTLLYGTDNLSEAYGFSGIPYICVIDKLGNIRYDQSGHSPDLEELLSIWVEDLQSEPVLKPTD